MDIKKYIRSYTWRAGVYVLVAAGVYLMNIADVRAIDLYKLATIFIVTLATYVVNEGTKVIRDQVVEE